MNQIKNYISTKFSEELKLIIHLTQNKLETEYQGNLAKIDWDTFLELAIKHRVISHILKHSTFLAEKIPISVYEKLIEIRLEHSKRALNFAIHAIRIHEEFNEQNIKHCFFKGPLLSIDLYNDVGYRNFRDIDVLVNINDVERAKKIIEDFNFTCVYPAIKLTEKQKKINYSISHHYHFVHSIQGVEIELHWNMTNPKSFLGLETNNIIFNKENLKVSNYELPYISKIENLVYQAAHGSIHQWYRLFWLKDFSVLITKTYENELKSAYNLAKHLKLDKTFVQACMLSNQIYNSKKIDFIKSKIESRLIKTALNSIHSTDLSHKKIIGKLRFVFYRLKLKKDSKYYRELLFRLRTHLSDWEIIKLKDSQFFLYYFLRPFLIIYKFFFRKKF